MLTVSPRTLPLISVTIEVSPGPNGVTLAGRRNERPKNDWRSRLCRPKRSRGFHHDVLLKAISPLIWPAIGVVRALGAPR